MGLLWYGACAFCRNYAHSRPVYDRNKRQKGAIPIVLAKPIHSKPWYSCNVGLVNGTPRGVYIPKFDGLILYYASGIHSMIRTSVITGPKLGVRLTGILSLGSCNTIAKSMLPITVGV
jgi:hypothetical protein